MRYLLDTNVVSAPLAVVPNAALMRRLSASSEQSAIASVVWHELLFGHGRLPESQRKHRIGAYLRDVVRPCYPVLPYDQDAAAWHATERARLDAAGTPAPFVDGQIASIAVTRGLVLVTANTKDFKRFRGLVVEDWTKRGAR